MAVLHHILKTWEKNSLQGFRYYSETLRQPFHKLKISKWESKEYVSKVKISCKQLFKATMLFHDFANTSQLPELFQFKRILLISLVNTPLFRLFRKQPYCPPFTSMGNLYTASEAVIKSILRSLPPNVTLPVQPAGTGIWAIFSPAAE